MRKTNKTKDKKSNNQVMVGEHDHCKHNEVGISSNNQNQHKPKDILPN